MKEAVWECGVSKSPGPDGFNIGFFKACWNTIKSDLLKVLDEFHANGKLEKGCNSSFIVLIPKKEGTCGLKDLRPISRINSLYKVIAKVLASRMKKVMGKLIGESQATFVKKRNILDGVVILNELIEDARKSKESRLFVKVDFAKAYDSVEWEYLFEMLRAMNFPKVWIKWIQGCVTSASANVLVNGSPSGEFRMERRLRQGDPLSPFLFLVAVEGLNLLAKKAIREGLIVPAKVGREKVEISHIQYAVDTIFAVEGSEENAAGVRWLLKCFEVVSGLPVNFDKSYMYGINLEREKMEELAMVWGCRVRDLPIPYLGIKVGGRINGVVIWTTC